MSKTLSVILWCLALIFSSSALAQPTVKDVRYGPLARNVLDIYLPEHPNGAPLVVYIHGGRWFRGDKDQIELNGRRQALLKAGYAIASINYTYSTQAPWPSQMNDAIAAIDWLRSHQQRFGFDASRMGLWGQSAGAHIVLMTGLTLSQRPDNPVKAMIAWFAPTALLQADEYFRKSTASDEAAGATDKVDPFSLLIGADVQRNPAAANAASPLVVLKTLPRQSRLPPVFLVHGDADPLVSPRQSEDMYKAMSQRTGQRAKLAWVPGGHHGGKEFDAFTAPSVDFLNQFLAR